MQVGRPQNRSAKLKRGHYRGSGSSVPCETPYAWVRWNSGLPETTFGDGKSAASIMLSPACTKGRRLGVASAVHSLRRPHSCPGSGSMQC